LFGIWPLYLEQLPGTGLLARLIVQIEKEDGTVHVKEECRGRMTAFMSGVNASGACRSFILLWDFWMEEMTMDI
jgi:hypothetical protein